MTESSETVGVVGGGTMGIGIAYVFAAAGATVTVVETDQARRAALHEQIVARAEKSVARGTATPELAAHVADIDELGVGLDVVVEAVPEIVELKHSVLTKIEAREPKLIGSDTSALAIGLLAKALAKPDRFIGMHFFNPVWAMPLLELIAGDDTSAETIAAAQQLALRIEKETILVRDVPGFATSRLGVALGLEAIRMLEDGVVSAEDIDRAMVLGYRHPMGPLRLTDLVGVDVRFHVATQLSESLGPRFEPPQLMRDMVDRGDLGQKSGRGFFDWSDR